MPGTPEGFLADGTGIHHPGITPDRVGEAAAGVPVVDAEHPTVMVDQVCRATMTEQAPLRT